jgi:DNA processing protein
MQAEIALTFIPNVGPQMAKNLIAYCGSAEAVFKSPKAKLVKVPGIGEQRAVSILGNKDAFKKAEEELKFISDFKIKTLFFTSADYPARLKECNDAPLILYYKGNADLNAARILAIVGTRNITEYGKEVTKQIVKDLSDTDILITSGLAYGVDIHAHNASLEFGLNNIGVLGHGLNRIYPEQHRNTAKKMVEQGGLLTEFSSQDDFTPHNFPQRNRIVAGMSDATLVIESAKKGGALITANIANSYNREVFAVPGKTTDKFSTGCNFLIKTYKAQIVESAKDILEAMNWDEVINKKGKKKSAQTKLNIALSKDEQKIYSLLKEGDEIEIDKLVAMSEMPSGKLAEVLLEMEMNDLIHSLPGKRYRLI